MPALWRKHGQVILPFPFALEPATPQAPKSHVHSLSVLTAQAETGPGFQSMRLGTRDAHARLFCTLLSTKLLPTDLRLTMEKRQCDVGP